MARMIGNTRVHPPCRQGCCDNRMSKDRATRIETKLWQKEAFEEIEDPAHEHGMCSDPKTGMGGCEWCYGGDYDWLPNGFAEDLDDIEGVTTNMKRISE